MANFDIICRLKRLVLSDYVIQKNCGERFVISVFWLDITSYKLSEVNGIFTIKYRIYYRGYFSLLETGPSSLANQSIGRNVSKKKIRLIFEVLAMDVWCQKKYRVGVEVRLPEWDPMHRWQFPTKQREKRNLRKVWRQFKGSWKDDYRRRIQGHKRSSNQYKLLAVVFESWNFTRG